MVCISYVSYINIFEEPKAAYVNNIFLHKFSVIVINIAQML